MTTFPASTVRWRLGTRGSPLALAQAEETRARLAAAHGLDPTTIAIVAIRTTGDAIQDRPLADSGGKGLFTKELDVALAEGAVDFTVHSAKDLPTLDAPGLHVAGYLPREDARDALIARDAATLEALPRGAKLGTASLRRQAMALRVRPDLAVSLLRGNVGTRLGKVESGALDATILAMAGLKRLGLADRATAALPIDVFPPAVGQGAIALVARRADPATAALLAPILHAPTGLALAAERAFLATLDGSCRTPIAGHATLAASRLRLVGAILSPDGALAREGAIEGDAAAAAALGRELGRRLLALEPVRR
ncbi:MAG: hydroxymethylbilane synthase [Hyphomicrobiales bacterium]|nr:hydroxymethylbilane synthase [Hyphomicrobiales bacterium]MDE2017150.1 hydroxymethylbilane synthase [Hyphomicrobiales bacterium]